MKQRMSSTSQESTSAGQQQSSNGSMAALGNSEKAKLILQQAAKQEGISQEQLLFGTHPDQFWFAEDGDDLSTGTGQRTQQKDSLPALRPKHEGSEYKDFTNGTAFVQGAGDEHAIDPNDVKQGSLGDCYLIAGMAAVARANPQLIADLIKDNGDGTYDVTLYIRPRRTGYPRKVVKTVDSRLAVKSGGSPVYAGVGDEKDGKQELWTALIEKTLAQHKASYDLISGGNIAKDNFAFAGASELLTGQIENYLSTDEMTAEEALLWIQIALESKKPVTAATKNIEDDELLTNEAKSKNVYWNHAYAPVSVNMEAKTVTLQNPWGSSHVQNLSADDFLKYYRNIRIGG